MRVLLLDVWPQVINKPVESLSSHSQDVVKHVGCVDVEKIFIEPPCGSWLHIPLRIQDSNVPNNKVKILPYMQVLHCIVFGIV